MGIREYFGRVRNYFSRKETVREQDERGRNAQVGYEQRKNLFDRFLDGLGKVAKYVGFTTVALTGIGAVALGVQYLRGGFPFREERENAYVIVQNTINEKPARPLKQGVNIYVPPFVRIVEENGLPVKIPGIVQSAETPDFMYRSAEGLQVKLKTQYNYQVNSPEGAAKVHWDYGGIKSAKETLDTIVENALMNELSKVKAKDIASEERIAQTGEKISFGKRYKIAKGGEKINFLIGAENKANEILDSERIGIVVTNFAISNPKYTAAVEAAWEAPTIASGKAEALITESQAEAQQSDLIFNTNLRQEQSLLEVAKKLFPNDTNAQAQYVGSRMAMNAQIRMVEDGARPVILTGGGFSSQTVPNIYINTGDVGRSEKPKEVISSV